MRPNEDFETPTLARLPFEGLATAAVIDTAASSATAAVISAIFFFIRAPLLMSVVPEDAARRRLFPERSDDAEAAVHEARVRVAEEAVDAFAEREDEALRPDEVHRRQHSVQPRPREVEVVDR